MAENIGEASVKITADITDVQQKVNQAKEAVEGLSGFKVNAEGFSGSLEEYNKWFEQANENVQTHEEYLAGVNRVMLDLEKHMEQFPAPVRETSEEVVNQIGYWEDLKDRIVNIGYAAEGSFERAKYEIQHIDRVGRTALIALSTAVTAFAKSSIDEYAKYNEAFAKSQENTEKSISRLKAAIGSMLAPISNVVGGIANWIADNQQLATGLFTTVAIIGGAAGLIAVIKKLSGALAALKITAGGVIGILAVIAGVLVGMNTETQDFSKTTEELLAEQEEQEAEAKNLEKAYNGYGSSLSNTKDKIDDILAAMEKLTRQYRQNLKQILVNHEDTVAKLTQQIKDANIDYQRAVDERTAAFKVSQAQEEKEHQEKVDALMEQIRFLQRYNNDYNREKLSQLQFALAKENRLYQERTQAEKEQLDIQLENERAKYEEKINAYQSELDEEIAFLNKHRELLNSVRGEILDDEVESLTRQYNEQMAAYQKQIEAARNSGLAAASDWAKAYSETLNSNKSIPDAFANLGKHSSDSFVKSINKWLLSDEGALGAISRAFNDFFYNMFGGGRMSLKGQIELVKRDILRQYMHDQGYEGWASGGYTGEGGPNEVAGIVHKGEYVLPQNMVDQTTHMPKNMGNITINVSGTFATSAMERRKVAEDIVAALQQTNYARLGA